MFSYNYAGKNLRILRTETQAVVTEFSKDYLSTPDIPTDKDIQQLFSKTIWWSNDRVEIYHEVHKLKLAFSFEDENLKLLSSVYEEDFDNIDEWSGHHRFVGMKPLSRWHVLKRIMRINAFYGVVIDKKIIASARNPKLKFSPESMHDFI